MITPGFFAFFNAQRGMYTAQGAMNVINHNISNVNTPGYSRQRANLEAYIPYTAPSLTLPSPANPGQLGQGSTISSITRIRDSFLDNQFIKEASTLGLNQSSKDILTQIEGIIGEPAAGGISNTMQKFFESAQELSLYPESMAVRSNFLQNATDMVNVFQQQGNQLSDLRRNLVGDVNAPGSLAVSQLGIMVTDVNNHLASIAALNQQINAVVAAGAQPNDLLDQRGKLVDELSELIDTTVTELPNQQIQIDIGGTTMVRGVTQLDSFQVVTNALAVPLPDDVPALVELTSSGAIQNNNITGGKIRAVLNMGENTAGLTNVRSVMGDLDTLLNEIATQVNALQTTGRDLTGNVSVNNVFNLAGGASLSLFRYSVNQVLVNSPDLLSAAIDDPGSTGPPAGYAGPGDGRNALAMAQLSSSSFAALNNSSFSEYFNTSTSNLGIDSKSYGDLSASQKNLVQALDQQRERVSGVNMDEEMVDLMRFQRAFEASSRVMNTMNQVMQTIINMGG
jgi:flagellar hook-associated protein 1 FlgK